MDDCKDCGYKTYCKHGFKYYPVNPCELILPKDKNILATIDSINEDLIAQYGDERGKYNQYGI